MFVSARMNDRENHLESARRNDRPVLPIDGQSTEMARSTLEQALETAAGATETEMTRAVRLATVATSLPHGRRADTMMALVAVAKPYERRLLLTNFVFAGEVIDAGLVKQGIADVVEAAETRGWPDEDEHQLSCWLSMLAFTPDVSETVAIVQTVPERHPPPRALDELLEALKHVPSDEAEEVVFALKEPEPELYSHRAWLDSVVERGTPSETGSSTLERPRFI